MHYGPASYHTLGRVFPRERLREPFARPRRGPRVEWYTAPAAPPLVDPGQRFTLVGTDTRRLTLTGSEQRRHTLVGADTRRVTGAG